MQRILFLAITVMIGVAFTMPRQEAGAIQQGTGITQQNNGKGKGPKEETIVVGQMTLDDLYPGTRLLSDGKERTGDDNDNDEFLELVPSTDPDGLVFYQAHQLPSDDTGNGIHPDPCTQFFISEASGGSIGRARALFNFSNCSVENPLYANDVRTFTMVFDLGSCACDQFRYLVETDVNGGIAREDGKPKRALMYNDKEAKTTYDEVGNICLVTPAAGAIETDSEFNKTGGQQIVAWPYEDRMGKKGRTKDQPLSGLTSVLFNFRTDLLNAGDGNRWNLLSQAENIPIIGNSADPDDPERVFSSDGNQLFDLHGPDGPGVACTDISLPFKITVERFDVIVQK